MVNSIKSMYMYIYVCFYNSHYIVKTVKFKLFIMFIIILIIIIINITPITHILSFIIPFFKVPVIKLCCNDCVKMYLYSNTSTPFNFKLCTSLCTSCTYIFAYINSKRIFNWCLTKQSKKVSAFLSCRYFMKLIN